MTEKSRLFFVLFFMLTILPTMAQHKFTLCGDTVISVQIKEDNCYLDWKPNIDEREMVYPPEAWIEFTPLRNDLQILLERKKQRTKTTTMDSLSILHLDSLIREIGVSRLATSADLGITEEMLNKCLKSRLLRKSMRKDSRVRLTLYRKDQINLDSLDQWLTTQYQRYMDTNRVSIICDRFFSIRIEIRLKHHDNIYASIWRYHPEESYYFKSGNRFNLNIYRHLCALMPKTFDFSYKDFQERLIIAYFFYLVTKPL
ncbi:MAG: hypothetical protein J5848_03350 [Bacteroidales bacterium]|nr:hypothetical protein [Bacteroidales bacterium]